MVSIVDKIQLNNFVRATHNFLKYLFHLSLLTEIKFSVGVVNLGHPVSPLSSMTVRNIRKIINIKGTRYFFKNCLLFIE